MRTVRLSEVASIERVGADPTALPPETRYLGLEHIERGGRILESGTVASAEVTSTKFAFTSEHVLYGKLRPYLGKISRPDFDGVCSTDILPIKPGSNLDRSYLTHYLSQPAMIEFANSRAAGASLPRLSPSTLAEFPVPLPPVDEQRRIAEVLDRVDAIRTKRHEILTHLDTLTQSIFHDMFGTLRASGTVGEIADKVRTGPFGSQLRHGEFVNEGVAVLGLDNVVGNTFGWGQRRYITLEKYAILRRYTVNPGDVLISIMGTTGRCVVVPDDIPTAINTKHICAITPDRTKAEPGYLRAAFLWHPDSRAHLVRQTKGSIMDGLNMGIIKSMPIPLPSLDRQRAFANKLAAVAIQQAAIKSALAADNELFASLQFRAFRGEL